VPKKPNANYLNMNVSASERISSPISAYNFPKRSRMTEEGSSTAKEQHQNSKQQGRENRDNHDGVLLQNNCMDKNISMKNATYKCGIMVARVQPPQPPSCDNVSLLNNTSIWDDILDEVKRNLETVKKFRRRRVRWL
jgi:hypothetical protein